MKKIIFTLLLMWILPAQAIEKYTIDPAHSYVLYHINHLGFSIQSGKWFANGTLELDKDKPENSKVNVTIAVAHVDSGIAELNKHLQGNLFFDVAKFPNATFTSNKVEVTSPTTAKIYGTLALHGISKPITLNVKFNQSGINQISNKPTVGFSGNTALKRSDFGMNTLVPSLGDDVSLDIQVEAFKAT